MFSMVNNAMWFSCLSLSLSLSHTHTHPCSCTYTHTHYVCPLETRTRRYSDTDKKAWIGLIFWGEIQIKLSPSCWESEALAVLTATRCANLKHILELPLKFLGQRRPPLLHWVTRQLRQWYAHLKHFLAARCPMLTRLTLTRFCRTTPELAQVVKHQALGLLCV